MNKIGAIRILKEKLKIEKKLLKPNDLDRELLIDALGTILKCVEDKESENTNE